MQTGQKVIIKNTNSIWDGKEGIVEAINEDTATVFVNFIPKEQKRVRQDFYLENLEEEVSNMNEDLLHEVDDDYNSDDAKTQKIIKALADHFEVDEDEIEVSSWGGGHNFIVGNAEYWVGTYDEAYEEAVAEARSVLDDLGLDALAPDYRDYAIRNFGDEEAVEDWMRESFEYYVEDIENERDSEFPNRLIRELYENDIINDEYFAKDEDDEVDYSELEGTIDIESKKALYVDKLCDQDAIKWLFFNFGNEEASKQLVDNNAIDYDAVAEDCVDTDGIAHYIASYDGDEIELADDLYAYRRN